MKIIINSPYASSRIETGVIYLLVSYLKQKFEDLSVSQIRCNGVFPSCERDGDSNWKRSFITCCNCNSEHAALAKWSNINIEELSRYVTAEDVSLSREWMQNINGENIREATFKGVNVFDLAVETVKNRLGDEKLDLRNGEHVAITKKFMLSSIRMYLASKKFNKDFHPDIAFIAGSLDFMTRSFAMQSYAQGIDMIIFNWDLATRTIRITNSRTGKCTSCDLLIENVSKLRQDVTTWPPAFIDILDDVINVLELDKLKDEQLSLQLMA